MSLCMSPPPKQQQPVQMPKDLGKLVRRRWRQSLAFPLPGPVADSSLSRQPSSSASFLKSLGAQTALHDSAFALCCVRDSHKQSAGWGTRAACSAITGLSVNEETIFRDVLVAGGLSLDPSQLTGRKVLFSLTSFYGRSTELCF